MTIDPNTRATSAVPKGVRDASEWALRLLIIGLGLYVAARAISAMSEIVVPVIVGILLCALLEPITRRLATRLPRGAAAAITVLGTLAIIGGLMTFIGSQFSAQLDDIHITDSQFSEYIQKARDSMSGSGNLGETATKAGLTATHVVAGFFISMFALFFFLFEGKAIWAWLVRLFPRSARAKVASSGQIAWGQLQAFCRATILVAAADATGIGLGARCWSSSARSCR